MKGRPDKFAPFKPGARPTMRSSELFSPQVGTGEFQPEGNFFLFSSLKFLRREQKSQLNVGYK